MDTIKFVFDFDTTHDKYKFFFANDTEEIQNYRNSVISRAKVKGNTQGLFDTLEKAALKEFEKAFIKAAKGNATITV